MGASPSKRLYQAAKFGKVDDLIAAQREGGDINYRNGHLQLTPLMTAAKHGQLNALSYLLQAGAADLRSVQGSTAMHLAAWTGEIGAIALLLDRGSDPFTRDNAGLRAIDVAARRGHTRIIRCMETRICPFFGFVELFSKGWLFLPSKWENHWLVVHRARPWDNPSVPRADVTLVAYSTVEQAFPVWEMIQPCISRAEQTPVPPGSPPGTEPMVSFVLNPRTSVTANRITGAARRPMQKSVTARCDVTTYNWLLAILGDDFPSGRGSGFDGNGSLHLPPRAQSLASTFATQTIAPGFAMRPQAFAPVQPTTAAPASTMPANANAAAPGATGTGLAIPPPNGVTGMLPPAAVNPALPPPLTLPGGRNGVAANGGFAPAPNSSRVSPTHAYTTLASQLPQAAAASTAASNTHPSAAAYPAQPSTAYPLSAFPPTSAMNHGYAASAFTASPAPASMNTMPSNSVHSGAAAARPAAPAHTAYPSTAATATTTRGAVAPPVAAGPALYPLLGPTAATTTLPGAVNSQITPSSSFNSTSASPASVINGAGAVPTYAAAPTGVGAPRYAASPAASSIAPSVTPSATPASTAASAPPDEDEEDPINVGLNYDNALTAKTGVAAGKSAAPRDTQPVVASAPAHSPATASTTPVNFAPMPVSAPVIMLGAEPRIAGTMPQTAPRAGTATAAPMAHPLPAPPTPMTPIRAVSDSENPSGVAYDDPTPPASTRALASNANGTDAAPNHIASAPIDMQHFPAVPTGPVHLPSVPLPASTPAARIPIAAAFA